MKCLEIINVRCSSKGNDVFGQFSLEKILRRTERRNRLQHIRLYRHASLSRDFSIHLLYKSSEHQVEESDLGLRLTSSLKEFGLVSHSLWVLEEDQ